MKWLKAIVVALIILSTWTSFAFISPSWHRLVFRIVPIDQTDSRSSIADWGREGFDWGITQSFFGRSLAEWHVSAAEAAHMVDVRRVWFGLIIFSAVGLRWLFTAKPEHIFGQAAIVVGVIGFVSALSFESAFLRLHQLVFPNGNWEFSPNSSLVRIYPEAFFAWIWMTIVLASAITLLAAYYLRKPQGVSRESR